MQHILPNPIPTPGRPARLRLACDNCSAAKVKCDKARPCERCSNNGLMCIYGVSRRHGKQSSLKTQAATASALSRSADSPMLSATDACFAPRVSTDGISSLDGSDRASVSNAPSRYPFWIQDDFEMPFGADEHALSTLDQQWSTYPITTTLSEVCNSQPPSLMSPQSMQWQESIPDSLMGSLDQNLNGLSEKLKHDCEARGIEVLRSLHHCPTDIVAGEKTLNDSSWIMPSTDKVFSANKAALSTLQTLFQCPCARNPALALLYISILSKTMFWYRVMATANYWQTSPADSDSSSSPSVCKGDLTRPAKGGIDLHSAKIQLGAFDLDEDDQATLQRSILLRELRKAEKVLESLTVSDAAVSSDYEYETDRAVEWYRMAFPKIREELQSAIQETKRRQLA